MIIVNYELTVVFLERGGGEREPSSGFLILLGCLLQASGR